MEKMEPFIRIILGLLFGWYGLNKLTTNRQVKIIFFEKIGLRPAAYWNVLIGCIELIGGIFLLFNLFTPIVALIFSIIIFFALLIKIKNRYLLATPAWLLTLILFSLLYLISLI